MFTGWWLTSDVTSRILVWKIFCGRIQVLWRKLTEKLLYRYWPWRSWNITFRWTAKRVIFSRSAQHWGKYCPEGKYNYLGTTDTWIFHPSRSISVILDGQNEWFPQNFMCSTTTTKFGNKTRRVRTKQNWTPTWQLARVLLLTTAYSAYAVHFFLGQFPNMELILLFLSPLFYLLNCYIFAIASLMLL